MPIDWEKAILRSDAASFSPASARRLVEITREALETPGPVVKDIVNEKRTS